MQCRRSIAVLKSGLLVIGAIPFLSMGCRHCQFISTQTFPSAARGFVYRPSQHNKQLSLYSMQRELVTLLQIFTYFSWVKQMTVSASLCATPIFVTITLLLCKHFKIQRPCQSQIFQIKFYLQNVSIELVNDRHHGNKNYSSKEMKESARDLYNFILQGAISFI